MKIFFIKAIRNPVITTFSLFIFSAILIIPNNAYADCDGDRCVSVKVTRLYVADHVGKIFIATSGNEKMLGCAPIEGEFIELSPDKQFFREIYATLLSAQISQQDVIIRIIPDGGSCKLAYVMIDNGYTKNP